MGAMAPPRPHHARIERQNGADLHLVVAFAFPRQPKPGQINSLVDVISGLLPRSSCGQRDLTMPDPARFTNAISAPTLVVSGALRSQRVERPATKTESQGRRQWLPRVVQHPTAASPVSFVTRELRPDERRGDPIPSSSEGSISSSAATSESRKPSCSSSESAALRASLARVTAASASVLARESIPRFEDQCLLPNASVTQSARNSATRLTVGIRLARTHTAEDSAASRGCESAVRRSLRKVFRRQLGLCSPAYQRSSHIRHCAEPTS